MEKGRRSVLALAFAAVVGTLGIAAYEGTFVQPAGKPTPFANTIFPR